MNYVDFEKIEQDEWSLTRPTFPTPKGGTLTVIGWCGKNGYNKKYVVHCSECSKDTELHGEGIFSSLKDSLKKGKFPCGCATSPQWTEKQYRVIIDRKLQNSNYSFVGFAENFKNNKTKVILSCTEHGKWNSSCIANIIKGVRCPQCFEDRRGKSTLLEDEIHIQNFMKTGKYKEGSKFSRIDGRTNGGNAYWNYTCPVCSKDEYVKAGLCSGNFEICHTSLTSGLLPCRCSINYRWKPLQREYQVKKIIKDKNTDYIFVSLSNNTKSVDFICERHGFQTLSLQRFLKGNYCRDCAIENQVYGYVHLIKDNNQPIGLKFGITNNIQNRLSQLSKGAFELENLIICKFESSKHCREAESRCKSILECGVFNKKEFPDGYTETTFLYNLDKIMSIYKSYGGDVIINNMVA